MTATIKGIATDTDIAYDVVSWGLRQCDADGFTIVHDGLSALTDETIAYLADWWLEH